MVVSFDDEDIGKMRKNAKALWRDTEDLLVSAPPDRWYVTKRLPDSVFSP
jgi:hypothetical protein